MCLDDILVCQVLARRPVDDAIDNAIAKIFWQRNMGLKCDAFALRSGKQIAESRDRGVATIGGDEKMGPKTFSLLRL